MKKILIPGATGTLGNALVSRLQNVAAHGQVTGLVRPDAAQPGKPD